MKHIHEANADEGSSGSSGTDGSSGLSEDSKEQTQAPEATPEANGGNVGDASAARERWEQDVEGYEHKQFDEAKEEYGRARKELDERFKEKIEKIKAQAASDLGTSGEGNVGEGNV